ncbi:hypothetical protein CAPTEDRAFT_108381 [Capitella teleta]|uniref:Estrogen-related receptor n=1 Tax=Capitella teleta TaxID=283909 RepID=R7U0E3_CAPTE|nr:hypothetical protein CAPTEDRAFT_108381 [Capitella teleta]|eukprot:ELT99464.1 hypothetical protein CAPTEDRAFT_108381 [Capitella teleta]
MDLDLSGISDLDVKIEPADDSLSNGINGIGRPLCEFNSDTDVSDLSLAKAFRCESSELSCGASSPDSVENKHEYCSSSTLPSDVENAEGPKRICLVCGDIASGYHYGVASCEACKAFFKRTIQGNIEYNCPANGNCEITKRRRKSCQACRFQKCLRMGMLKEGVRLDRVRGGRQKYKRNSDVSNPTFSVSQSFSPQAKMPCYDDNKMLAALLSIEPDKVYAMPDPGLPDDDYKLMATLSDLADRELVATIGWAKQVPGFINLPLPDQMNLLQSTWLDIMCFNLAYRSTPYKCLLVYADDFKCSEEYAKELGSPPELDAVNRKLAEKLSNLSVTREEYVLLKAMLLLNPDIGVESPETVQQLRDRMHDSLLEYSRARTPNSSSSVFSAQRRVGNLLLTMPILMQVRILAKEYWFNVKKGGRVPLHKLLSEMLEYACAS